jgi:hypothetical protein
MDVWDYLESTDAMIVALALLVFGTLPAFDLYSSTFLLFPYRPTLCISSGRPDHGCFTLGRLDHYSMLPARRHIVRCLWCAYHQS